VRQFCECDADGWCARYRREMSGRCREICAGVNCDLGTVAAFREQWRREAGLDPYPRLREINARAGSVPLLLRTGQAPGDAVVMTAAIYSLHRAHPGRYVTAVESYWPDVFEHNPDVCAHLMPGDPGAPPPEGMSEVRMHYPAVHQSNERGIHFMQGFTEFLGSALGVDVPLLTNRPRLYFDIPAPPVEDFWLICSGGKRDFTNKLWGFANYQSVVSSLKGRVRFVQVGGARPPVPWHPDTRGAQEDSHPPLDGLYKNMIGMTSLRDLFELCRRARGVLCGVSLLMHVAAALERPAIVVAGGREPVAWNAYPLQQYLHTVGALPCTDALGRAGGACWRYRVVPLGDGTSLDRNTCQRPVGGVPECMTLIRPEEVVNLILRYNRRYEGVEVAGVKT
jgi:ADP-heptose:LPS heptosyltransferase